MKRVHGMQGWVPALISPKGFDSFLSIIWPSRLQGLFSFAFDYLNIEKARENSLYALFVREKLNDHWLAKVRECAPDGSRCPPPRGSNGLGPLGFQSDAEGVGDAGGVKLTCAKKLGEYPNACSGYFNATLAWDKRQQGNFAHQKTMAPSTMAWGCISSAPMKLKQPAVLSKCAFPWVRWMAFVGRSTR